MKLKDGIYLRKLFGSRLRCYYKLCLRRTLVRSNQFRQNYHFDQFSFNILMGKGWLLRSLLCFAWFMPGYRSLRDQRIQIS